MRRIGLVGLLQLATIAALGGALVAALLLLHHQTDDYFVPLPTFFSSFKVALPPAAIFIGSYIIAFLTGTALGDVPKEVLSFMRNRYFQSITMMTSTIAATAMLVAYTTWVSSNVTPPFYNEVVKLLLGGSSDNLVIVREKIDRIRKVDPAFASRLGKVVEVFSERYAVNAGQKPLSGERARTLVRTLEADDEPGWISHPLRQHALAEAYSLFGQSVRRAATSTTSARPNDPSAPYRKAVELYEAVYSSHSPLAPPILKTSALANTGNAFYYMGNNEAALGAWQRAAHDHADQPNLSPWSNVVAALVMLDRPNEAVAEGKQARAWAEKSGKALVETYSFAGVLENTAFAKLQLGDIDDAVADFATANAFREDDLTKQNLALALIIAGQRQEAGDVLRQLVAPLAAGDEPSRKIAACAYLIWALALPIEPPGPRAANLAAFLGEQMSPREISGMTPKDMAALMTKAAKKLPDSDKPCGSLGKIAKAMALFLPAGNIAEGLPSGSGGTTAQ